MALTVEFYTFFLHLWKNVSHVSVMEVCIPQRIFLEEFDLISQQVLSSSVDIRKVRNEGIYLREGTRVQIKGNMEDKS